MSNSKARIALDLLGNVQLTALPAGDPLRIRRKGQALLAFLALQETRQARHRLVDLFCREANDPFGALRSLLSRLRGKVGQVLQSEDHLVWLEPSELMLDCREFEHILGQDPQQHEPSVLAAVLDRYRGPLMADVALPDSPEFEMWLLNRRSYYQQLFERGLLAIIPMYASQGQLNTAIHWAEKLVQANSINEMGHHFLIDYYARNGQLDAARAQFAQCKRILAEALAVEPSNELQKLYESLSTGLLDGANEAPAVLDARQASGRLIGRAGEAGELEAYWHALGEGQPGIILVEAEAGLGKTSLVETFLRSRAEAHICTGGCYETGIQLAYGPWLEIFESLVAQISPEALRGLSAFSQDALVRIWPGLRRHLGLARSMGGQASSDRNSFLYAVVEFLSLVAPDKALVLFLDDLQWADSASLQLLMFLARRPSPRKLLLIGAQRPEDSSQNAHFQSMRRDLARLPLLTLRLQPLDLTQTAEMIGEQWPELPKGYRSHMVSVLHDATAGNPLFLTEMLAELVGSTDVPTALPVPDSVRDIVRRRLSAVPASSRQVLESLAIFDGPVPAAQAQSASGRTEDETYFALDQGFRLGLLNNTTIQARAAFEYKHGLLLDAVMAEMSLARKQLLHRRVAAVLERQEQPAARLAYHWRQTGDLEQEAVFSYQAGLAASRAFALAEAMAYLTRAETITTRQPALSEVWLELGQILEHQGEWKQAEQKFQAAYDWAVRADDDHMRARCLTSFGWLQIDRGGFPKAVEHFDRALTLLAGSTQIADVVDASAGRGLTALRMGDFQTAEIFFGENMERASQQSDPVALSKALSNWGILMAMKEDRVLAREYFIESLDLSRKFGDLYRVSAQLGNLASMEHQDQNYESSLSYRIEEIDLCHQVGDIAGLAIAAGNLGALYLALGLAPVANDCYLASLKLCLDVDDRWTLAWAVAGLARGHVLIGEMQIADRAFQQSLLLGQVAQDLHGLCMNELQAARLYMSLERISDALILAESAFEHAQAVQRSDVLLAAHLLALRLGVQGGTQLAASAAEICRAYLAERMDADEQGLIYYTLWQLQPDDVGQRAAEMAANLFRDHAAQTGNYESRRRFQILTGESLPAAEIASQLPEPLRLADNEPAALLDRVEGLLSELDIPAG
jgi:DNA-binding SARP family transcriptional activator/tetratricopeptide (TPR) repeat protein